MSFKEFKKVCINESNIFYANYSHSGINIRAKINSIDTPYPDALILHFDCGSLTLFEDNCEIREIPRPDHLDIDCYFCYGIKSGYNFESREHVGFIYKPKDKTYGNRNLKLIK